MLSRTCRQDENHPSFKTRLLIYWNLYIYIYICIYNGPGGSSGKALGYGLDGPGLIPGVGGVEILLDSFVSRLILGSTQPPIK